ncbi:Pyridoxal phosphate (PLP)-dependent transferase superfamily protein [Trifolium repens]|nr:Pyridoxal phosphate (PLP)-dependent transferase superfamily protein [Trifolium repens]
MGTNNQEHEILDAGSEVTYQEMVENEVKDTRKGATQKIIAESCKSNSMVIKKGHAMIPAHIIAEAISSIREIDLRWSGPITPKEMEYVEQYVVAKYPEYSRLIEGDGNGIDMSTFIINEEPLDEKGKSPRGTPSPRDSVAYSFGSSLPDSDRAKIQLEPSRLLDILNKKSSFTGSFISIPEIQAQNKVLKHYGLADDEYLVLFTPSYKDAMMLVGESYPFVKGNYYMTILDQEEDYIKEFAFFKESKVIPAPKTWLDLRIKGSQLSQNFRRRCKISPKGLFTYPADASGTMHWISEAHRNHWHVLLDASAYVVGKDRLHLALHRPDFVICSLDNNTNSSPSRITCLLVRKESFDTSAASSQVE